MKQKIHCSNCGKSVSSVFEVSDNDFILRAYIECPECIEKSEQNVPEGPSSAERSVYPLLADVRAVLNQKINVYEVTPGNWAFANAGIISDGFSEKYFAEIEALRAIINGGIMVSENFS